MWGNQFTWTYSGTGPLFQTTNNIAIFYCVLHFEKSGSFSRTCHDVPQLHNGVSLHYVVWVQTMRDNSQSCRWQVKSQFTLFKNFANLSNDVPSSTMFTSKETRKQEMRYQFKNENTNVIGYVRNSIRLTVRYYFRL